MKKQAFWFFLLLGLAAGEVFAAPDFVTLDFGRKTADVEFDDATATTQQLMEATQFAGYPSSVRESRP